MALASIQVINIPLLLDYHTWRKDLWAHLSISCSTNGNVISLHVIQIHIGAYFAMGILQQIKQNTCLDDLMHNNISTHHIW